MVTVYEMSLQTNFELIFTIDPRQFMKTTYSLYENSLTLSYLFSSQKNYFTFCIEIVYT